ncbi:MAG: class I tRNA ligase family protein [Verrucomicrobia bacterium]|nr:class I tRNA ligase family protein [Verrucomicrobiota bacterium]
MYLEGSDQHRGWFQSSLLLALAANDAPPYQTVLTHGFVVGDTGEKEAKSRGSKSATLWVNDFGADVLRLWVASQDYRGDMVLSEARMQQVAETYRLLRNTLRYQLANLYDFDPARHAVPDSQLTPLDRWILHAFAHLENDVLRAYEAYEFHQVYQRLGQFAAVELSAIYHDVIKDRLYTDPADSSRRRSTQTTLHRLCTSLCQMLAPMLAFTADEAWEFLPGRSKPSVHETVWQPLGRVADPADVALWTRLFQLRDPALVTLEQARRDKTIGKALEAQLQFVGPAALLDPIAPHAELLRELLNVSALTFTHAEDADQIRIQVAAAEGRKCERCWHWEPTVGAHATHPTLCHRCLTALGSHLNI